MGKIPILSYRAHRLHSDASVRGDIAAFSAALCGRPDASDHLDGGVRRPVRFLASAGSGFGSGLLGRCSTHGVGGGALGRRAGNLRNRSAGGDAGAARSPRWQSYLAARSGGRIEPGFCRDWSACCRGRRFRQSGGTTDCTDTADVVESGAQRLYDGSTPDVVRAQAPVLLLEGVLEPTLCRALMDHWRRSDKLADGVVSASP